MNRRDRRVAEATGMTLADSTPSYQGVVRGSVSYGVAGSPTTITLGQLQFVRPERTFPADCGAARLRHDSPEVHFVQLDPYNEKRIVRALVVRFDRGRFVERAKHNEPFRLELEQKLSAPAPTTTPDIEHRAARQQGAFLALFESASFGPDAPVTAIVDGEFELISYTGGRACMVILVTGQNQLASALAARAKEIAFDPALEVTMTPAVLADVLLSWDKLAKEIAA